MDFVLDQNGWCKRACQIPSPNYNARPQNQSVSLLVIHNITLPPGEFGGSYIIDLFLNRLDCQLHPFFEQLRELRVSSHFLIRRNGDLIQFVPTEKRAWHAGVSSFNGHENCNDFSIGVEIEGTDFVPFESAQYQTLVALTQALVQRYPEMQYVSGHEHIAPNRKTDPGPFFDWKEYRKLLEAKGIMLDFWLGH